MSRHYRLPTMAYMLAEKIAIQHNCTASDVKDLMYHLQMENTQSMEWACEVYGGLRDLGMNHSYVCNNFGLISATSQVLRLMKKPNPFGQPPKERLIRED